MRKIEISFLLALCALCLAAEPAPAWDKMGHMVIAQIALNRLESSRDTRTLRALNTLAAEFNRDRLSHSAKSPYPAYNAVTLAAWMDDIKDWDKQFNAYHYINFPCKGATSAVVKKVPPPNVYDALVGQGIGVYGNCLQVLKSKRQPTAARARALAFLLHLEGDIHQHYHCYAELRGGNDFKITLDPPTPDFTPPNLHILWDGAYKYDWDSKHTAITIYDPLLRDERQFPRSTETGMMVIQKLARAIAQANPSSRTATMSDPVQWALESSRISCASVPAAATVTPAYIHKAHDIACQRLALAGYRLAGLLHRVLRRA